MEENFVEIISKSNQIKNIKTNDSITKLFTNSIDKFVKTLKNQLQKKFKTFIVTFLII